MRRRGPAREGAMGETLEHCGPATTSVGDAAARWPQQRGGLAAPQLPPQSRTHAHGQWCDGIGRRGERLDVAWKGQWVLMQSQRSDDAEAE